VALVLLINAAWQQGDTERPVHIILRWSARIACGLLLVFSALAAWSLWLRIAQYGLTPERTLALVGVTIALLYGLGYAAAAVIPKGWLVLLAPVNIALAFITALICLCILTPIADPYRLSASSQAARVDSGKVTPDKFDWRVLRFETGTYGLEELKRLGKNGKTEAIRKAAANSAAMSDGFRWGSPPVPVKSAKANADRFHMVQPDTTIPKSFITQVFTPDEFTPECFRDATLPPCDTALIDLNNDGKPEIVLLYEAWVNVYTEKDGVWLSLGNAGHLKEEAINDFKSGKISAVKPSWNDLKVGVSIFDIQDDERNGENARSGKADVDFVAY